MASISLLCSDCRFGSLQTATTRVYFDVVCTVHHIAMY